LDVLFGQSYFLRFDPKLWASMQPYPPLGTLYAAAYLRERGHEVAVFDSMLAMSEAEWAAEVAYRRPRFAVLYEDNFNYLSKMCLLRMREAAFAMMAAARQAGCTVIVCGSDATDHLTEYFDHGADYALLGEGELSLGELVEALSREDAGDVTEIAGIAFRGPDGGTVRTPKREFLRELDRLPFPAWDLVDVGRYRAIWKERHGYFSMNMVTTRGCPYRCNWCAKPIYGRRYNARSPENVAAELARLRSAYAPDHIWFADDIFGLKPDWIDRYAELVTAAGTAVPFKCLLRADLVNPRVVDALRRAGCRTVWLGAESGSQKVLDAMDKGTRVEQIEEAARLLRGAAIEVGFFLQFGYPGETLAEVEATLAMVRRCRPDALGVSVSYPLPGTEFYERVRAQLGPQTNWIDSDDLAMLYQGPYPPDFYRAVHRLVHKEFRLRRHLEVLRSALRPPHRLRPWHGRPVAASLFHAATLPVVRRRVRRLAVPNPAPAGPVGG
jgi:radical SAM superfamily enzyme YgiQ (UPF0313 family)